MNLGEGTETSLFTCQGMSNTIGSSNCSHSSDAGVSCSSGRCYTERTELVIIGQMHFWPTFIDSFAFITKER